MRNDDVYERWRHAQASVDVPDGFADRVMAAVEQHDRQRRGLAFRELVRLLVASRLGRIAVWSLACSVCALRIAAVLAVFLVE